MTVAGVYTDDSLITKVIASKVYADAEMDMHATFPPGAKITVRKEVA